LFVCVAVHWFTLKSPSPPALLPPGPVPGPGQERCKSKIADLNNAAGSPGAITAALFLRRFVTDATPWAHLDMAGPVWDKDSGATGFGVQVLVDYAAGQGLASSEN
jgi:leucyl aminopeptidase